MTSWTTQLLTLAGVAVGALASFASTQMRDRSQWRRQEILRWENKRLECYSKYANAIMHYINIGYRITAGLGLNEDVQPLDHSAGLPQLAEAESDLSVYWETLRILGTPEVITAASVWRRAAWHLDRFARGVRKDPTEYAEASNDRRAAARAFYAAVRADLKIPSSDLPPLPPHFNPGWSRPDTSEKP